MTPLSKLLLLIALIVFVLACNFIPQQVKDVQNLAGTAQSVASSIPDIAGTAESMLTSMPDIATTMEAVTTGIPDLEEYNYFNPEGTPLSEWNGIPIMPQASAGQEFNESTYSFKASATVTETQEYYKTELVNLGWSSTFDIPIEASGGIMLFSKENNLLTITLTVVDTETVVVLTLA